MQCNPNSRGEIFVIDDDAAARATLAGALTLAGYEVICFADGAGLLARAQNPDSALRVSRRRRSRQMPV